MKKVLLLGVAFSVCGLLANAQSKKAVLGVVKDNKAKIDRYDGPAYPLAPVKTYAQSTSGKNSALTLTKTQIGTSYNLYGLLVSESTMINVVPSKNWVTFTHRVCSNIPNVEVGDMYMQVSTDGGETWPSSCSFKVATSYSAAVGGVDERKRYPSGVISNPSSSSTLTDAYAVIAGPITNDNGWVGNYFSSRKFDGTDYNDLVIMNDTAAQFQTMPRIDMIATDNNMVHVLGTENDINDNADDNVNVVLNSGTFNSTTKTFDWTTKVFSHPFKQAPSDGSNVAYSTGNQAWSRDGQTGYVILVGADGDQDVNSYQPVFYKTTDAGATWNQLAVVDYGKNNRNQFLPYLDTLATGEMLPQYFKTYGSSAAIDADGNPHYISAVLSGYSTDQDSLGFTTTNFPDGGPINFFDTFYKDGNWQVIKVGTLNADNVAEADDDLFTTGFDCRFQTTVDLTTNKIFYSWMDSDVSGGILLNKSPDIMVSCVDFDLQSGTYLDAFIDMNTTIGSDYEAFNYWMYAADYALNDGTNICIPMTTSELISGTDGTTPSRHYYLDGVCFVNGDLTTQIPLSVSKTAENKTIKSTVYPNPTSGSTNINFSLKSASVVTVSVKNIFGQEVKQVSANAVAGNNSVEVNMSTLAAGVYTYSVVTTDGTFSGRIVKE